MPTTFLAYFLIGGCASDGGKMRNRFVCSKWQPLTKETLNADNFFSVFFDWWLRQRWRKNEKLIANLR
jgi:hypothetical protein